MKFATAAPGREIIMHNVLVHVWVAGFFNEKCGVLNKLGKKAFFLIWLDPLGTEIVYILFPKRHGR